MKRLSTVGLVVLVLAGCGSHATTGQHSEGARSGPFITRTPSGGFVLHNAGGPIPAIDRALLLAYGSTFVDLRHGDARRFCDDFTSDVASKLVRAIARTLKMVRGSSCTASFDRLFSVSGQSKRGPTSGYDMSQALRSVGIGEIKQQGEAATAKITNFFERRLGQTIAFRRVSGSWLIASAPHLRGAYFTCTPAGSTPCTGAGVFTLSY